MPRPTRPRQPPTNGAIRFVALLRGINVGGRNAVGMVELREVAESLGLTDVRTLLQSGNLVFSAEDQTPSPASLEKRLQRAAETRFGFAIDFLVRSESEWQAVVAANPFAEAARRDPGHLVVNCLKEAVNESTVAALREAIVGREEIALSAGGRELYTVYPDGIGRSKLTNAVIERKLGTRATGRNWNTVLKLAAILGAPPA